MGATDRILTAGVRLLRDVVEKAMRRPDQRRPRADRDQPPGRQPQQRRRDDRRDDRRDTPRTSGAYPGDFTDRPRISYTPFDDRAADPGEVVWTWVPYEEDHAKGKDRPVLIIGRDGRWLLGLQVTSQDHDRDKGQEASQGRYWEDIGTGAWDRERRPSEARVNRIIRVDPDAIRRVGAVLPRERFDAVTDAVLRHY